MFTNMYGQIYDSEDEVRIYVNDEALNTGVSPQYVVFNLNGKKGAILEMSVPEYSRGADPATNRSNDRLLDDEHYFEKLIFTDEILLVNYQSKDKLTSDGYTYAYILMDKFSNGLEYMQPNKNYTIWMFEFSYDGKHMKIGRGILRGGMGLVRDKKVTGNFTRVSKQKLDELIITNKKESGKKWR